MVITVGVACSIGVPVDRGGRAHHGDNYLVCEHGRLAWREGTGEHHEKAAGHGVLVAVADGMGGAAAPVASTAAMRILSRLYQERAPKDPKRALRRYVLEAHRRLHRRARVDGPVRMGTTLTTCWLLDDAVSWLQVGDSRLYLQRGGALRQLTPEHTLGEFAQRDGQVGRDGHLAQAFIYGSRGLGDDTSLRLEPGRDTGTEPLEAGDRLVLCTDGLWRWVDDVSLADVLRHTPDPQAAAVACMERAMARGSTDNITVIVVGVG